MTITLKPVSMKSATNNTFSVFNKMSMELCVTHDLVMGTSLLFSPGGSGVTVSNTTCLKWDMTAASASKTPRMLREDYTQRSFVPYTCP